MQADLPPLNDVSRRAWDVVVVGAGMAGPLAAHGLARQGLAVLLVDKAPLARWKVCGACLNPFSLSVLSRAGLGDVPQRCGAVTIRTMRLAVRGRQADISLPGWKVLSRERFDAALVEAAVQAGAGFLPRTLAALGPAHPDSRTVILRQEGREERVSARLVLAADGLGGRLLAGEQGWQVVSEAASRVGAGVIAEQGPEFYREGVIYMAYGSGGYVGLVRLEDGRLNLAAALDMTKLREVHGPGAVAAELLQEVGWPAVHDLSELPWRGTPALTRQPVRPASERVLAIGDSAGYVEPFTGEGMGWALASGAAVISLADQGVSDWQPVLADRWAAMHRRSAARRQRLCRAIAWVSRHPSIARALVGLAAHLPWLAAPFVGKAQAASACRRSWHPA